MRRIQFILFAIACTTIFAFGQYTSIDNFDTSSVHMNRNLEAPSTMTLVNDAASKYEGAASLKVHAVLADKHSWGTFAEWGYDAPEGQVFNWSTSESLSVWIKVNMAPSKPAIISFRYQFTDQPNAADALEFWDYENFTILDNVNAGWVNLRVALKERTSENGQTPDSTGFTLPPADWGLSRNNLKFDLDKIKGWRFVIVSSTIDIDSIDVSFDKFERFGTKAVPVLFFNGIDFNSPVDGAAWAWGESTIGIETGAGTVANTNAVKWVQGTNPGWGADSGYTGWGVNLTPTNMVGAWAKDTLKFKMKAAAEGAGVDDSLRVQLEGGGGKTGIVFDLIDDGAWHSYAFPLKNFVYQDNTGHMDSTKVNVLGFMAQNSGRKGRTIYITDIWTGNPVFDVIPPEAPTGVAAIPGSFVNVVTWTDVPNEPDAKYNVFFSEEVFTDISDPSVEDLPPYKLAPATGAVSHVLRAPATDQNISYYYGVNAIDGSSNVSPVAVSAKVTTMAKGTPVINNGMPVNYATDASLTEWTTAGIKPIVISKTPATGEGHVVTGGAVDNDADLTVKSYLAMDANNLYAAFDVVDDIVVTDSALDIAGSYGNDCPDLFIGLYDFRGKRHTGYKGGATPDYHLRFSKYALYLDNPGNGKKLMLPGANYVWKKKSLTPGYTIEAKIPFQVLADSVSGAALFVPQLGKRIPIDFSVNDNDGKPIDLGQPWTARDGILCYSQFNDDNSWQDMWRWSHTWIGPQWKPTGVKQEDMVARQFELSQNYPNPFNPTTNIHYSLPKAGYVTLKLYDVLGREVMSVVDEHQSEGTYTVRLDASTLATGMYMYRLESGSLVSMKKMLLVK